MSRIRAFVGHSFDSADKEVVRQFLDFFNGLMKMNMGFSWEHAEDAEPKLLSQKVLGLMEGKNLFIGICTGRERAITDGKLRRGRWRRNLLSSEEQHFERKTSDWIIQEIGLAKGRGMEMILLLEEGIRRPGGLQGDLEYVPFSRNEPSIAFPKIVQMIGSLEPRQPVGETVPPEQVVPEEKTEAKPEGEESLEPEAGWTKLDYEYALFRAIADDDQQTEKKIIDAYSRTEEGKTEDGRASLKARALSFCQIVGKGAQVHGLEQLLQEHPENSVVARCLAEAYEHYRDYEKAEIFFRRASDNAVALEEKLSLLCAAAMARSRQSGNTDAERSLLEETRDLVGKVQGGAEVLFSTLATIASGSKQDEKYLAYTEVLLDLRPEDTSTRFSLAYRYSGLNRDALALRHYLLIPYKDRSSSEWNNMGVAYGELGLPTKSIQAYRKSEEMGGTLAMSNLAQKFIDAGFLKEADEICRRATEIENYDKQVGTAITRIKRTRENEEEKNQKLLSDVEPGRKFYIAFGKACTKSPVADGDRAWSSPECPLKVRINGDAFLATGEFEKVEGRFGLARGLLDLAAGAGQSKKETFLVRYEGHITGLGVEFRKHVSKKGALPPTLLSGDDTEAGLMVIKDDGEGARVYLPKKGASGDFYDLTRIEA